MLVSFKSITNRIKEMKLTPVLVKRQHQSEELDDYVIEKKIDDRDFYIEKTIRFTTDLYQSLGINENETWSHLRDLNNYDKEKIKKITNFGLNNINDNAENYFNQTEIRVKELDWLFVEGLILLTYVTTESKDIEDISRVYLPNLTLFMENLGEGKYFTLVYSVLVFLIKWTILIGLLIYLFINSHENIIFGILGVGIIFYWLFKRYKTRKIWENIKLEMLNKLSLVERVYGLVSTSNIHWDVLEKELEVTRTKGINWPSSLYTIIKSNRK